MIPRESTTEREIISKCLCISEVNTTTFFCFPSSAYSSSGVFLSPTTQMHHPFKFDCFMMASDGSKIVVTTLQCSQTIDESSSAYSGFVVSPLGCIYLLKSSFDRSNVCFCSPLNNFPLVALLVGESSRVEVVIIDPPDSVVMFTSGDWW